MDVFLITRALQNLLDNAYKFGREDGWIRAALSRDAEGAVIIVADNGIGIAQDQLDQIFKRFYQIEENRGTQTGLGLGLSMVEQIVRLHGGTIEVKSKLGAGTTFTVRLPEHQINK